MSPADPEGLFFPRLPRPEDGHGVRMAGIIENAKIRSGNRLENSENIRGPVKSKSRFEFPADVQTAIGRRLHAFFPGGYDPFQGELLIDFLENGRRLDRVHADGLNSKIDAKIAILHKLLEILAGVFG